MTPRPRLRPTLDVLPGQAGDGEPLLVFRDREGLAEDYPVSVTLGQILCQLLDGEQDLEGIRREWSSLTSAPTSLLDEILARLENALLLEGEMVEEARRAALAAYRSLPRRPAGYVGQSYPADAAGVAANLAEWRRETDLAEVAGPVTAVMAPHIEPRGGRLCYGAAAAALAACPAEVFVVLGTAHQPLARPFALTTLDFETPSGVLTTDRVLVERLSRRGGGDLLDAERAHEIEHSVEFQAVWLKSIHADRANLRIVPVLVGSQLPAILAGTAPDEDGAVADFIAALRELRAEYGEKLALVASVDLAHIGPIYGDTEEPDAKRLQAVTSADQRLLAHATAIDAEGWCRFLYAEQDERNVCGATPTYVLLAALADEDLEGRLLRHDIWEIHPESHSHVSFATVAFTPRS